MTVVALEELEEMAFDLGASARNLPKAPDRDELLRDIANFRAITAQLTRLRAKRYGAN